jgi:hypothetical protein
MTVFLAFTRCREYGTGVDSTAAASFIGLRWAVSTRSRQAGAQVKTMKQLELTYGVERRILAIREEYRTRGHEPSTEEITAAFRERHPELYQLWGEQWLCDIASNIDQD